MKKRILSPESFPAPRYNTGLHVQIECILIDVIEIRLLLIKAFEKVPTGIARFRPGPFPAIVSVIFDD
jgi:hypothetical protein